MAVGAVAASIGVAAAVVGAVLHKKNKKAKATKEVDDMVAIRTP
jgi:hypothetical protein